MQQSNSSNKAIIALVVVVLLVAAGGTAVVLGNNKPAANISVSRISFFIGVRFIISRFNKRSIFISVQRHEHSWYALMLPPAQYKLQV